MPLDFVMINYWVHLACKSLRPFTLDEEMTKVEFMQSASNT